VERAVRTEAVNVFGERAFDLSGLIVEVRAGSVDDLLQAEDVSVELLEDGDDARRRGAAVEAATLVDVVGDDAKAV
jgi:hypothetical protein